jgi:hypothetical protein
MLDFERHSSKKGSTVADQEREERRLRKRYPVSALARYRWQDSNGDWISDSAMTLNISVAGIYILTPSSPPTGVPVEVRVPVPVPGIVARRPCLVGQGFVIRVDPEVGFAAQIDLQMFRIQPSGAT